jgi:1-acyl-sn-glycerol-3-phosphate acyltransferase
MIRTAAALLFVAACIFLILPFFLLYSWISGSAALMYGAAMKALRVALWTAGVRVVVEGAENVPAGTCIFVSNHVSNLDPPILAPFMGKQVAILAKKEVFRIPVLGWAMRAAHFVPVDRGDREAAAASVDQAIDYLKRGISFLIFAEGTRSVDGRLKAFKNGTFLMAIEAGVKVVPVSLSGSQKLMRKGTWLISPGVARIKFGPAVDAASYGVDARGELRDRVHELVEEGLEGDQRSGGSNT